MMYIIILPWIHRLWPGRLPLAASHRRDPRTERRAPKKSRKKRKKDLKNQIRGISGKKAIKHRKIQNKRREYNTSYYTYM
jgi:hypothetical protein